MSKGNDDSSKIISRKFYKHYDQINTFMKEVFYYGTKTNNRLDISAHCDGTDYSKLYAKLKSVLKYDFGDVLREHKERDDEDTEVSLWMDHFYDPHRAFFRLYTLKSFTSPQRLMRICAILEMLSKDGECTVSELMERCGATYKSTQDITTDMYLKGLLAKDKINKEISGQASRTRKIGKDEFGNDITDETVYSITQNKKVISYRLAFDTDLLDKEKTILLADLCTNIYPLSVCGSSIQHKLSRDYESPFLFKHCHLGQAFNDELIWKLIICIYDRTPVSVALKGKEYVLHDLLPYRIITSKESGRQYVFVVYVGEENYHEYQLIRLSSIASIAREEHDYVLPEEEVLKEKYETAFRYSFNGTTILARDEEPETGIIVYDKEIEWMVTKRFHDAVPDEYDECHNKITVKVNSLRELKPWLRVNSDRVWLIESSDDTLSDMKDELKKWREMYGLV